MIKCNDEMEVQHAFLVAGGNGNISKRIILKPNEVNDKVKLFARITLPVGSSIGEHQHTADSEIYYIICGDVVVTDNGEAKTLHAGDVVYTGVGCRHSIENIGVSPAEFIAVILE